MLSDELEVEAFVAETFHVERTRPLRPHEFGDLAIIRRTVRKHGNVAPIERMMLSWIGRPITGYLVKPKPKVVAPKAQQQSLF